MSKKARLSAEDKRNVVLSIFHETADVYVLKDVEKLGSKKGINSMLIKEILQSLVDDNLVHQEKIGISNYFWSFPSEASAKLQSEGDKLSADVQRVEQRAAALREKLEQEKQSKQQTVRMAGKGKQ
ncbi:meiotic nuclear division protein 1 [Dunaliella salina]|uniref:Meiotic nuclear division protein 1 n=1 Tax=Dunaliella salina TaxID=3046 RepID=A0ABQ7G0N7_DUNSA|nr:meiotic nuclear division protein 1 [Dunaliella salina]|eukprot:KAF5828158.1 meiotic nuclear division protein 1 [Dunaliella salina]